MKGLKTHNHLKRRSLCKIQILQSIVQEEQEMEIFHLARKFKMHTEHNNKPQRLIMIIQIVLSVTEYILIPIKVTFIIRWRHRYLIWVSHIAWILVLVMNFYIIND